MEDGVFARAMGPEAGARYRLAAGIAGAFPGKHVVAIEHTFDVEEFARAGKCAATLRAEPHAEVVASWRRSGPLWNALRNGSYDVRWEEQDFVVLHGTWREGFDRFACWYAVGTTREATERFVDACARWCNDPHDAVLAFRGGCWEKEHSLYQSIAASSFDDLILAGDLATEIRTDFTTFMESRAQYEKYGVPWKRGVLLLGPPGNGKTHCLRAVIKMLGVPCLYVQSLKARYETDDANIARVFARAREVTPCCLVFEDLDAMITDENRSTFLNQLDGFANTSGILTLATTNHPERLDPSILDRPSRFDRKYHFALPAVGERHRYIEAWRGRLDRAMRIEDAEVARLAAETEGFSFAYLKELFLSSMIRWMPARHEEGAMATLLFAQLGTLRAQMTTSTGAVAKVAGASLPDDILNVIRAAMPSK